MSVALIYLARGIDGGSPAAKAFFESHAAFPPGRDHELIVAMKGWSSGDERDESMELARSMDAQVVDLPDDGFDWGAYMRLAPLLKHTWLCFLNTHSRPCAAGWLNFLHTAASARDGRTGAAGATGSWESFLPVSFLPSADDSASVLKYPLLVCENVIRFAVNVGRFPAFPNPHLRSNAIFVKRSLFTEFVTGKSLPRNKRDAFALESGRSSFTSFLTGRGLHVVVAGADGKVYEQGQWHASRTFRSSDQSNLIVSDNQTRIYQNANRETRARLGKLAWGASPGPSEGTPK